MSPDAGRPGLLVALVGPSGVGKDALMSGAARHPALNPCIRFARRTVTRPSLPGSEEHDSLDEAAFAQAEMAGAFALSWRAHGLHYGLPRCVGDDVAAGYTVVANLSRRSLTDAAAAFLRLRIVEVAARPEILLARLLARGRESEEATRTRLARREAVSIPAFCEGHTMLDNSGELASAVRSLVDHLNMWCDA